MQAKALGAAIAFAFVLPAFAAEPEDPVRLLEAMSRNFRELNYGGVFTYERGQHISSARIVHAVKNGVEHERLEHLDGSHREFLRLDHPLDCEHTGNRLLGFGPGALGGAGADVKAEDAARLVRYYALELDGEERVASREGWRLRVSPRDPYRYGMNLVLDAASAMLLKAETTDGAGRVLERFQFVDVQIGDQIDTSQVLHAAHGSRIEAAHTDIPAAAPAFDWVVAWLPEGFALSARELRQDRETGREVEAQAYTDGLATFEVFVERGLRDVLAPGEATRGATVAYTTPRGDGSVVTVVGEIPMSTARLIANAVNFRDSPP